MPQLGLTVGGQEGGVGPILDVVSFIYVESLVSINPYWHRFFLNKLRNFIIGVGGLVHEVTPVAPNSANA